MPHQSYVDRDESSETILVEDRLPAGWAALSIFGLSVAAWALIAVAVWLY